MPCQRRPRMCSKEGNATMTVDHKRYDLFPSNTYRIQRIEEWKRKGSRVSVALIRDIDVFLRCGLCPSRKRSSAAPLHQSVEALSPPVQLTRLRSCTCHSDRSESSVSVDVLIDITITLSINRYTAIACELSYVRTLHPSRVQTLPSISAVTNHPLREPQSMVLPLLKTYALPRALDILT